MAGLTKEQVQNFKKQFDKVNSDADEGITAKELLVLLPPGASEQDAQDIINSVDSDGKPQRMNFGEWLDLMKQNLASQQSDAELREEFRIFDSDSNGFITAKELKEVLARMGESKTAAEIDGIFRGFDKDGNGKVDYKEFVRGKSEQRLLLDNKKVAAKKKPAKKQPKLSPKSQQLLKTFVAEEWAAEHVAEKAKTSNIEQKWMATDVLAPKSNEQTDSGSWMPFALPSAQTSFIGLGVAIPLLAAMFVCGKRFRRGANISAPVAEVDEETDFGPVPLVDSERVVE
eukprot:TRINITY_DN55253_c0_g1_i1.p1 TRINITY_DN55253_c0_g1~~TRINITY_DN55253_c0_g1_i1.p1  ORF type:complete len:323 (+),score=65.77 TRINITY_DN55253_c0_g1_i1:114-971(+)